MLKLREENRKQYASGGPKYPIVPFTGEISYGWFKGCQKYFWRPLKSAYGISPVKLHLGHFGPPEVRQGGAGGAAAGEGRV